MVQRELRFKSLGQNYIMVLGILDEDGRKVHR
jgi:hypothetical protein